MWQDAASFEWPLGADDVDGQQPDVAHEPQEPLPRTQRSVNEIWPRRPDVAQVGPVMALFTIPRGEEPAATLVLGCFPMASRSAQKSGKPTGRRRVPTQKKTQPPKK